MRLLRWLPCAAAIVLPGSLACAQLMTENFAYDAGVLTTVASGTWIVNSGAGNKAITVADGNLSYTGYAPSGLGRQISLVSTKASAEDAYRQFTTVATPGSVVYAACLITVTDTAAIAENTNVSGEYFMAFLPASGTSNYASRVCIRKGASGNTFQLGIKAGTASAQAPVWHTADLSIGQTHLIVNAYELVAGTANDIARLWVDPAIGATPPVPDAQQTSTSDIADVARFGLRQGYTSGIGTTPNVIIDGIQVSEFWEETLLPIQLASFAAVRVANEVLLSWRTISEQNNFGFYVERKSEGTSSFTEIPNSFVAGHATSLEPHEYLYTDRTATAGVWYYRLRQVDLDGKASYSDPVKVEVSTGVAMEAPFRYALSQNSPNPFNPSTEIEFSLGRAGTVSLKVFDVLGREIATLASGEMDAGLHRVRFSADNLPSGAYFYLLRSGTFAALKQMMVLK